jgi:hypothetical protein
MMQKVCIAAIRRAGIGVSVLAASLVAMMFVGVAVASACAYYARPTAGTYLYVHVSPSTGSRTVGSMSYGHEFYGSCVSSGWIKVNSDWSYGWNSGSPPFYYVNRKYAAPV